MFNKRFYLDYNSTTPLSSSVKKRFTSEQIPFANPSSQHSSGKKSHKLINDAKKIIFNYFGLNSSYFDIVFHSGATEGINTILGSQKDSTIFYFESDHPCVKETAKSLSGVSLDINREGMFDINFVKESIKSCSKDATLNYTFLNNETGVVWPLEIALNIKHETNCFVHVDAVQMIGRHRKINLLNELDAYTFSGHKFGALKGVGFSFIKKGSAYSPIVLGGGQQDNLRSGTLNLHGILSIIDALEDIQKNDELFEKVHKLKKDIVHLLSNDKDILVIPNDSFNTICFMHERQKSDAMLIQFDLEGLDVSTGSACSSGSLRPSDTLIAMGFGRLADHNIRLSLGIENLSDREEILSKIKSVLGKL